jgi:hypothetical protein
MMNYIHASAVLLWLVLGLCRTVQCYVCNGICTTYNLKRIHQSFYLRASAYEEEGDEEVSDAIYITVEELKRKWSTAGKSLESFTELAAISLFDQDDDEDYDMEDLHMSSTVSLDVSASKYKEVYEQLKSESSSTLKASSSISDLKPISKGKSVGIDLGTTFSSVSVVEGGVPVIIKIDGSSLVPSIVAYLGGDKILVGELARRQMIVNNKNTFSSVKRIMGVSVKQAKENGEKLNLLKVDSTSKEVCTLKSPALNNKLLLPEEISAQVLKYLLSHASKYLNEEVTRAVITVPAYFKPIQSKATERAGLLAGLEKVKILREPEAAALAYGLNKKTAQVILVFDLGGGTLDVSILDVGDGVVEVKATSGDSHLGIYDYHQFLHFTFSIIISICINIDITIIRTLIVAWY